jgi:hypothetical protein
MTGRSVWVAMLGAVSGLAVVRDAEAGQYNCEVHCRRSVPGLRDGGQYRTPVTWRMPRQL